MNVNVVGWYNHGNVGDDNYCLSFPIVLPNHSFTFSETPIENADAYILGGGDVVSDAFLAPFQKLSKAPKHIMSASMSKVIDVSLFNSIALRDKQSIENALQSGYKANYAPDFAFALTENKHHGIELIKKYFAKNDLYEKVVGIVINSYLMPQPNDDFSINRYTVFEHFSYQLARALNEIDASFIFMPFGTLAPADDRVSNGMVSSRCKFFKKNAVIYDPITVQDSLDIIAACDAVISTRLHSSIFSCLTSTPFVDITHNHKNAAFIETVGLNKLSIPYVGFSYKDLIQKLNDALNNAEIKKELYVISNEQKVKLKEFSSTITMSVTHD